MEKYQYNNDDLIAALATPWGVSALAVIRTSGEGSIERIAQIFSEPDLLKNAEGYTMVYGSIVDPKQKEIIDRVIAAVYRAPKSYTGQESVEISCHGGMPGVLGIIKTLKEIGFRDAAPGEFTFRAFINKKMDLTRAEAVQEIVTSKTRKAQSLALNRLSGAVESRINKCKEGLLSIMSYIELQLDYPEDEIMEDADISIGDIIDIRTEIKILAESYGTGKIYQDGILIVIAGKTNAGKSSLFNLFLKEDRAIVSEIHGTTRDYIESWINIGGIPAALCDTAGLRDSEHPVEAEGIKRSKNVIKNARIILYLIDASIGISAEDRTHINNDKNGKIITVWNKIDITDAPCPDGFIPISSKTGEGFPVLENEIRKRAIGECSFSGDAVIGSLRQQELLEKTLTALDYVIKSAEAKKPLDILAVDMKDALDALGEITGEVTSADILENIFSNFCVGK